MENNKQKYIELLKNKSEHISELKVNPKTQNIFQWKNEILMILENLIGEESKYYKKMECISFQALIIGGEEDYEADKEMAISGLEEAESLIKSILYGAENNLI